MLGRFILKNIISRKYNGIFGLAKCLGHNPIRNFSIIQSEVKENIETKKETKKMKEKIDKEPKNKEANNKKSKKKEEIKKETLNNDNQANIPEDKNPKEKKISTKTESSRKARELKKKKVGASKKLKKGLKAIKPADKKTKDVKSKNETIQPKTEPTNDKFKEFANYLTEYDRKAIRRKFFSKNFRTDILPTIKFLQENAEFNKKDFSSLLIQKPKIFLMLESNNDKYKINQTLSIKEIHSFFTKEYEFDAISFKNLLLKFPQIFRMTLKEIVEILNYAKESLELDEIQMKTILSIIPKIFDKKLKNKIDDFKRLNDAYLMISNKELGGVLARFPYIFEIPIDQIKENIRVLRRYSFDTSHILILMEKDCEFLCNKPNNLERCFEIIKRYKMPIEEHVREIYTQNPKLFSVCPTSIMPLKIRLFNQYGFNKDYQKIMFLKYPKIFIKSLSSLQSKLIYLTKLMNIDLHTEESFPAILLYSYRNIIRPRGEIMKLKKNIIPWTDVLNLKDIEFCEKLNITLEELHKSKREIKKSFELDIKKRFFSQYFKIGGKKDQKPIEN